MTRLAPGETVYPHHPHGGAANESPRWVYVTEPQRGSGIVRQRAVECVPDVLELKAPQPFDGSGDQATSGSSGLHGVAQHLQMLAAFDAARVENSARRP